MCPSSIPAPCPSCISARWAVLVLVVLALRRELNDPKLLRRENRSFLLCVGVYGTSAETLKSAPGVVGVRGESFPAGAETLDVMLEYEPNEVTLRRRQKRVFFSWGMPPDTLTDVWSAPSAMMELVVLVDKLRGLFAAMSEGTRAFPTTKGRVFDPATAILSDNLASPCATCDVPNHLGVRIEKRYVVW
eukprot:comp23233_c0_seq1/m.37905 comp23233_c0_seq1/g.37905  ORF comp23233_c0_seq1/g.37905 comp23233_c0_seq1/m.37905 type:complete len:189 (+) comp23233_c0_seq1:1427-1993(+)